MCLANLYTIYMRLIFILRSVNCEAENPAVTFESSMKFAATSRGFPFDLHGRVQMSRRDEDQWGRVVHSFAGCVRQVGQR
jgi:hypothetical protein